MRPDVRSGPPPDTGSRPQKSVSTRTTTSVTDSPDTLRGLVDRAAALVAEIGDQADRDRQSYDAGYREAMAFCRAMFDHGVDVGYAQAEEDMARAWRPVAKSVRSIPRQMEICERRREVTCSAYCTHRGCKSLVTVPPRVDFRRVLCPSHQPKTWCERHRDRDSCDYTAELQSTQRAEHTGGPAEWEGTSPPEPRPTAPDERSRAELLRLRGRDRYPLPDRECPHCQGTGMISGGAA